MLTVNLGQPSINLSLYTMIPAHYAAKINIMKKSGSKTSVPSPRHMANLPMLAVSDLLNKKADIPSHWVRIAAVAPVLPLGNGTLCVDIRLPTDDVAVQVCVKSVNVRTGLPYQSALTDEPRQSYFLGTNSIKGYLLPTSDGFLQFAFLSDAQTAADVAAYKGITQSDPYGDAVVAALYYPLLMEKLMSVDEQAPYYEAFSKGVPEMAMRSLSLEAFEATGGNIGIGAGGFVSGSSPDDPTIKADMYPDLPTFPLIVYLVPVSYYNELATTVHRPKLEAEQLKDFRSTQVKFERELGKFLNEGVDTGTDIWSLPEIPYEDSGLEVMRAKVPSAGSKSLEGIPDTMLVAGINFE